MDNIPRPAEFLNAIISKEKKTLTWMAREDTSHFVYNIEQYRWNKWIKIGSFSSTGKNDTLNGSISLEGWIHSGTNKFRIKACTLFCFYSKEITLEGPGTMPDKIAGHYRDKPIEFPFETHYELYDSYGNIIKKGFGKTLDITALPRGMYYLAYDNKIVDVYR